MVLKTAALSDTMRFGLVRRVMKPLSFLWNSSAVCDLVISKCTARVVADVNIKM